MAESSKADKGEIGEVCCEKGEDNDKEPGNEAYESNTIIESTRNLVSLSESIPTTTAAITAAATEVLTASSQSPNGRISPTLFLPEARVRPPLTPEQKQDIKTTKKKTEKRKLKLHEMDPEDLMLRASEKGRFDLVEYSLNKNPLIHQCHDSDLYTPLHRACYGGHLDIVQLLVERGANVRARTVDGWQPLHSACRWGQVHVVSYLLENLADINAQTNGKQTPLHLAALGVGGSDTLKLLLSNKSIDCSLINNQGERACDVAKRCGKWLEFFDK